MTTPGALTVGAMFAGYGGLDLAVEQVFGASLSWVAENDPGASRILAARFPDVPNLGDVTTLWDRLFDQPDPVDIITGGSPCQDLSNAGKRAGMRTRHPFRAVGRDVRRSRHTPAAVRGLGKRERSAQCQSQ